MTEQKKLIENVDYELVPAEGIEDAWGVRILTGDYVESVIVYENLAFNKVKDALTFNFVVASSPEVNLSAEDPDLQKYAGNLLSSIIEVGLEEGYVHFEDLEEETK
jgi:hypothetical protein